jgi:disulfide bond formation protein DsbB
MTVDEVSLFLALLALCAEVTVVATIVLAVLARASRRVAPVATDAAELLGSIALPLAFLVGAVSTAGSLYFSEVAHFIPCKLCWYQRICMYPQVVLLGIAAWRRDYNIRIYAGVLAAIGMVVSSYHVLVEHYPNLESRVCDPTNPCTLIWVKRLGYITIPTMALSGFALIITLLVLARPPLFDE